MVGWDAGSADIHAPTSRDKVDIKGAVDQGKHIPTALTAHADALGLDDIVLHTIAITQRPLGSITAAIKALSLVAGIDFPHTITILLVKVGLDAVGYIVKTARIEGKLGERCIMLAVVIQHNIQKLRADKLILLAVKLHVVIHESTAIAACTRRLYPAWLIVYLKTLATIVDIVADAPADGKRR